MNTPYDDLNVQLLRFEALIAALRHPFVFDMKSGERVRCGRTEEGWRLFWGNVPLLRAHIAIRLEFAEGAAGFLSQAKSEQRLSMTRIQDATSTLNALLDAQEKEG